MKLTSSSPKSRHTHTVGSQRGWALKRLRSRFVSTLFSVRGLWMVLIVIVAAFAIAVFHLLRQALETNLQT